jgi:hypothetical protein
MRKLPHGVVTLNDSSFFFYVPYPVVLGTITKYVTAVNTPGVISVIWKRASISGVSANVTLIGCVDGNLLLLLWQQIQPSTYPHFSLGGKGDP